MQLLGELESRLPHDCEQRVQTTVNQYNQRVRTRLSHDTRLNLQGDRSDGNTRTGIQIRVVPGYPVAFLEAFGQLQQEDSVLALIEIGAKDILDLQQSAHNVRRLLEQIYRFQPDLPEVDDKYFQAFDTVEELALILAQKIGQAKLLKTIFAIQEDILGTYLPKSDTEGYIELYWAAIGILANLLNVTIEDLATVVLIHELAHGYTHLGKDIDNKSWNTSHMFTKKNQAVAEGLAQYYTHVLSQYLGHSARPDIFLVYEALHKQQTGYYRIHDEWINEYSLEVVRAALLKFRREGKQGIEPFVAILAQEKKDLQHDTVRLNMGN